MPLEIERKFLVNKPAWEKLSKGEAVLYRQGYILSDPEKTIRVRVSDKNGFITLKGKSEGISRAEYEYPIPKQDAIELLDQFCNAELSKYRYEVHHAGKLWEVDVFLSYNYL